MSAITDWIRQELAKKRAGQQVQVQQTPVKKANPTLDWIRQELAKKKQVAGSQQKKVQQAPQTTPYQQQMLRFPATLPLKGYSPTAFASTPDNSLGTSIYQQPNALGQYNTNRWRYFR